MKKNDFLWMAKTAIIASLYVALTIISYPFSYGMIQFRISEILMLLCFYNKKYTTSCVIGCLIANLFSFNLIDCIFGTLATFLACIIMSKIKNRYISSLMPVLFNAVIIGLELYFYLDLPLIYSMLGVAVGEIVVVTIIGNLLCYFIEKNNQLMELITTK